MTDEEGVGLTVKPWEGLKERGVAGALGGTRVAKPFAASAIRVMAVGQDHDSVDSVVAGLAGVGHVALAADLNNLDEHPSLAARTPNELGSLRALTRLAAVLRMRGR